MGENEPPLHLIRKKWVGRNCCMHDKTTQIGYSKTGQGIKDMQEAGRHVETILAIPDTRIYAPQPTISSMTRASIDSTANNLIKGASMYDIHRI